MTPHPVLVDWAGSAEQAETFQLQLIDTAHKFADAAYARGLPFGVLLVALRIANDKVTASVAKHAASLGVTIDDCEELETASLELVQTAARERWEELGGSCGS